MPIAMAIVQSSITGKWGYCPEAARKLLRLEYDAEACFDSDLDALAAIRADDSVPRSFTHSIYPTPLQESMRVPGPRGPSDAERADLIDAMAAEDGTDTEMATEVIDAARIAIFDRYISDGPGYTGRVAFLLHSGGPELHDVAVWRNGEAVIVNKGA